MRSNSLPGDIPGAIKYRFTRKIASGGMGSVYEAEQYGVEGFVKKVAIKTILPKYTDNDEFVSMFIGEAKLVANLVHQNIVQMYHLGNEDNMYYISMEYIDGINLEEFLTHHIESDKTIPVDLCTFIISRVCRGLEYAHNKRGADGDLLGVVHRDVSPKNIMITAEGEVKLTDFGVAKAALYMEQKEGDVLMGKVEYMSPEQASYMITDGRSDLFSLGVVYYELLTGVNIFECDDVFEIIERVKTTPIPDPRTYRPELPESIVEIVMKMLERDVDERYATAGELGYALEYQMYSKGYGPTIITLAKYASNEFPDRKYYSSRSVDSDPVVDTMADTLYQTKK